MSLMIMIVGALRTSSPLLDITDGCQEAKHAAHLIVGGRQGQLYLAMHFIPSYLTNCYEILTKAQ
jgi:hypothetical protein